MKNNLPILPAAFVLALAFPLASPHAAMAGLSAKDRCQKDIVSSLRRCTKALAKAELSCQAATSASCTAGDAAVVSALDDLGASVLASCPNTATVTATGFGAAMTPATLVDRMKEACTSANASLAARSFGGPHSAVRATADATGQACLDAAFGQGRRLLDYALKLQARCALAAQAGRTCDAASVQGKIAARSSRTASAVASKCSNLQDLVAVTPPVFAARAADQAECLVATGVPDHAPLPLDCGPRAAVPVPAAGVATQVVLSSAQWGTRCGDGSNYSFWIRLAPTGKPVNRVVVFTQGGGSCSDGPDCASTSPSLFNASDPLPTNGILSTTDVTNPFRDWTMVFLPYCTQDAHAGGGIVNAFPEKTVYRYGAPNLRAAMRYLRDVLWTSMEASDAEGFRPDRLKVLFSGSSAGGIGVQFNYHYILDDLRWVHSTLLADSALGPDNGAGSALARGNLVFGATTPGWGGEPFAPPYCHDSTCGEGWNRFALATSERLLGEPEQQMLSLSNQTDSTQKAVGSFGTMVSFVNTVRSRYCAQQGAPGLHSFLSANTTPNHGNVAKSQFNTTTSAGVLMRDWLAAAMATPESTADAVSEGTLVADYPGVQPFACTVAP